MLRSGVTELVANLRGLSLLAIKKLTEVCKTGFEHHMIDDYEFLVHEKEKKVCELTEVQVVHLTTGEQKAPFGGVCAQKEDGKQRGEPR